jgi:hypothetical protein
MKNKTLLALLVAASVINGPPAFAEESQSGAVVRYHIVTAPTSADNNNSLQNVMSFVDKRGVVGLIPTDVAANPAALNLPHVLRVCDIIYGPAGLYQWDGVVNPGAPFAAQNGKRLATSLDYTNTTPFLASDMYFALWSSDPANTIRFSGNVGTNGTTPLTFSPTVRGELWDANGNKIATYYNGESIADHPINRLMVLIRLGYYATDASQVSLDLNYFRNQMSITNYVAFYTSSGWGATNWISSRPWLMAQGANGNGDQIVTLEGQRRLNIKYGIRRTLSLDPGHVSWTPVTTGMDDGGTYTNTLPMAFYEAYEEGVVSSFARGGPATPPVLRVTVGPEVEEK